MGVLFEQPAIPILALAHAAECRHGVREQPHADDQQDEAVQIGLLQLALEGAVVGFAQRIAGALHVRRGTVAHHAVDLDLVRKHLLRVLQDVLQLGAGGRRQALLFPAQAIDLQADQLIVGLRGSEPQQEHVAQQRMQRGAKPGRRLRIG